MPVIYPHLKTDVPKNLVTMSLHCMYHSIVIHFIFNIIGPGCW